MISKNEGFSIVHSFSNYKIRLNGLFLINSSFDHLDIK
mgnify:CR=1 FL=1